MNKRTIKDADLSGKTVFVRVDFNVPIKNGVIEDDTRIRGAIPTIKYALDGGAKVVLASHLGRPLKDKKKAEEKGAEFDISKYSLKPVYEYLRQLPEFQEVSSRGEEPVATGGDGSALGRAEVEAVAEGGCARTRRAERSVGVRSARLVDRGALARRLGSITLRRTGLLHVRRAGRPPQQHAHHHEDAGWSITPAIAKAMASADPRDPLFHPVDGTDCPISSNSNPTANSTELLSRGNIRVELGIPAGADFTLNGFADPRNCATRPSASRLFLYRRPLPNANVAFLATVMWDGREPNRFSQAVDATLGHAQGSVPPTAAEQQQIIDDLSSGGCSVPLVRKNGQRVLGIITRANQQQLEIQVQFGSFPLPWTDLSPQSVLQISHFYMRPALPPDNLADRKWRAGVFCIFAQLVAEGQALMTEAAAQKAEQDRLAAEDDALTLRPFFAGYFGKQQRQYDEEDPAGLGFTHPDNTVSAFGDKLFGVKGGVQRAAFQSIDKVVGLEATRNIAPGQPLDDQYVRTPRLVKRGDVVDIISRAGGVQIRTKARAREEGGDGDLINVELLSDRRSLLTRVSGLQQVEITPPAAAVTK